MKASAPIVAIALVALCITGISPAVAHAAEKDQAAEEGHPTGEGDSLTAMVQDLEGDHAQRRDDLKDPHYLSGVYHFMNGDYDAALNEFLAGLETTPDNPYLQYSLGYTYYKKGKPALAAQYFNSAVTLKPEEPIFLYMAGVAEYDNNDFDAAEESFNQTIAVAGPSRYSESAQSYLGLIDQQRKAVAVREVRDKRWRLKAYMAVEYDDNVLLTNETLVIGGEELDDDDIVVSLFLSGEYDLIQRPNQRLSARYALAQTLHDTVDEFDYQRHAVELGYQYYMPHEIIPTLFGVRYAFYYDLLDSDDFQTAHNVFATAQVFEPRNLSTVLELHYADKNSEDNTYDYLEGDEESVDLSQLWFFHNKKGYLQIGLRAKQEDLEDQEGEQVFFGRTRFLRLVKVEKRDFFRSYSYDAKSIYLAAHIPIYREDTFLDLGAEFMTKDYDDDDVIFLKVDERFRKTREDDQQRYSAAVTHALNDKFQVGVSYRHINNDSNFDGSDDEPDREYEQNIYGLNLTGSF